MPNFNKIRTIEKILTVTAGAYTGDDVVGGRLQFTIPGGGTSFTVRDIVLVDDDNLKAALNVYFYDDVPTDFDDNVEFAPVIADLKKTRRKVIIAAGNYETLNSNAYAVKEDLNIDIDTDGGDKVEGDFYVYLVDPTGVTYITTTALTLYVTGWVDRFV